MSSSDDVAAVRGWATSGAMALTGRSDGPPRLGPGDPAGLVARCLDLVAEATTRRTGRAPALPDTRLLGERAAIAGLGRQAPASCGGAFRAVPARDGHVGLSLARRSDLELVPALVGSDALAGRIDRAVDEDRAPDWVWSAVADWVAVVDVADAVGRARLLGLPVAGVPTDAPSLVAVPGWDRGTRVRRTGAERPTPASPLVVDLTSLWAGPLCAHLLGRLGCRVVKVEAVGRPDGARRGPARFFDLLHAGHEMVAVDFATGAGRAQLAALVRRADVVLEGSRPRALRQLGIEAEAAVDAGTTWLSITAHGRDVDAVGFGDDVAVAAGLHLRDDDGTPVPCGDALADPLTGVAAAAAAAETLLAPAARLVEVSMWHVARAALVAVPSPPPHRVERRPDGWWVEHEAGADRVADPWARPASGVAGPVGADTAAVLR